MVDLTKALNLSAAQILAIPADQPERLFTNNADEIKSLFRQLAKKWHPDRNPGDKQAGEAFARLASLKAKADEKLEAGIWEEPGVVRLQQKSGKTATIHYLKKHDFELGQFYICDGQIAYVVRPEFKDLFDNALNAIRNFKFPNDKVRNYFQPQLPEFIGKFETADGNHVMVIKRDNDMILLKDLLEHKGGKLESAHACWIMSRLHNMTCYLQKMGLTHNAISLDTVFVLPKQTSFTRSASQPIAPKDHTMSLLGGWWYFAKEGEMLKGLPAKAVNYTPRSVLETGKADCRIDHTMIRVVGRELLGDITGVRLGHGGTVKQAVVDWLTLPGTGDAVKDYEIWQQKVLPDSFGTRRFTEMDVKPSDIYQPL